MEELKTVEKYLEVYGGAVTATSPSMDMFGKISLAFSRPVVFPT